MFRVLPSFVTCRVCGVITTHVLTNDRSVCSGGVVPTSLGNPPHHAPIVWFSLHVSCFNLEKLSWFCPLHSVLLSMVMLVILVV